VRALDEHLKEQLEEESFRRLYAVELQLAKLALRIHHSRELLGFSQAEVARRAKVTQQQVSRLESGLNCNIATLLKICTALRVEVQLETIAGPLSVEEAVLPQLA